MNLNKSNLIGKIANIPSFDGKFHGDWGRIVAFDSEYYHISFADDKNDVKIFTRDEIHIPRNQK